MPLPIGIRSLQVLLQTAKEASKNKDDVALSVLLWDLCHNVLLGGHGPVVKIPHVLQMIHQVPHPQTSKHLMQ